MLKCIIQSTNISQNQKNNYIKNINNKKQINKINCIYGLDNEQFDNYIKIGSTNNPQKRKFDYITSSPFPYKYLWIFYLKDFDCYLFDDILKHELKYYNIKNVSSGIEFYKLSDYRIIEQIIIKYDIQYDIEFGDKYLKKVDLKSYENNNYKNIMDASMLKMLEMWEKFPKEEREKFMSLTKTDNIKIDANIDLSNYKYLFVNKQLNNINIDFSEFDSQSIEFFVNKLKNNIKNIIILGLIQSGKTKEIIGIIQFCIIYLRIPIIVLIQNRTSGYKQLDERIKKFNTLLVNYNIKTRYVKTGINKRSSKKIFNYENPQAEVIICLSNYKQLQKIVDNIKFVAIEEKKIAPYVLIMDEYDDHIKTRQDESEIENYKIVEKSNKYLMENSYINVGVTATLLACMLTDNNTTVDDIFQLTPSENYVGYDSPRINLIDISDAIKVANNKRILHISEINNIMRAINDSIDCSVENIQQCKDYSITLINTSDNKKTHDNIFEEIYNEFTDWSCIIFNSSNDYIKCSLPNETYSAVKIIPGTYVDVKDATKIIDITRSKIKICVNDYIYQYIPKDKQYVFRDSITFQNYSISEIITYLLQYTNKIAIISGRMACRGISFVTTDFTKHITDMIYVPSGSSHLTRNVQDMRIYGNFPNDNINITLYTDKENYINNIGGYIMIQKKILCDEYDDINDDDYSKFLVNKNISLSQHIMNCTFNPEDVPSKKIDRIGLVKGFKFKYEDVWGIPTNFIDYDICHNDLLQKFPDYEIVCYSKVINLDLSNINYENIIGQFIEPTKDNKLSSTYNRLFKNYFMDEIQETAYSFNNFKKDNKYKINEFEKMYIYNNFRNGWPLHNPLKIPNNRKLQQLCYMGYNANKNFKIILKNPIIDKPFLNNCIQKKKVIIIFYSRNSYHYTKCDLQCYYIEDKKQ